MVFDTGGKNPHHRRLPRDARHILNRLRRPGLTPYRRAVVLHAQVAALDYAVNRREKRRMPLPAEVPGSIAEGQRVRLGVEVRDLLNKLHESKNLREQQALVREIRHAILRRIVIHIARSKTIQSGLIRAEKGLIWLRNLGVAAATRLADRLKKIRDARKTARRQARSDRAVRVVGHREREIRTRTRQPVAGRARRTLPAGERTGLLGRPRPSRVRTKA